jgi:hypothetical protein
VASRFTAWVCGRLDPGITGLNPAWSMSTSREFCVLWGRGLCVKLITRKEESYRMWCVWVWSWSLDNKEAVVHWGLLHYGGEKKLHNTLKRWKNLFWLSLNVLGITDVRQSDIHTPTTETPVLRPTAFEFHLVTDMLKMCITRHWCIAGRADQIWK